MIEPKNRSTGSSVSAAVSVPVRSAVSRPVHNCAIARFPSTHRERLTSVPSRTPRQPATPSRVSTIAIETTDEAGILLPEVPNPQPTGGR
jgi:hypothetical protein